MLSNTGAEKYTDILTALQSESWGTVSN